MIYTSYFAKATKLNLDDKVLVCIARRIPSWVDITNTIHLINLAPGEQLLKDYKANKISEDTFKDKYLKELDDNIGLDNIISYFQEIEKDSLDNKIDMILCCYEAPDKFCHRKILSEFLRPYINIKELD